MLHCQTASVLPAIFAAIRNKLAQQFVRRLAPLHKGANSVSLFLTLAALLCVAISTPAQATTAQTITLQTLGNVTYSAAPITAMASTSSGLPVTFASTTPAVCTLSAPSSIGSYTSTNITLLAAGTCNITADQPGNSTYSPAPTVTGSFSIAMANETLTFAALPNVSVSHVPFSVTASASCGLPVNFSASPSSVCTVSGNTVTLVGSGTCTVTASQPGNAGCNTAPSVSQPFSVTSIAPPTVTETSPTNGQQFVAGNPITLSATATNVGGSIAQVQFYSGATLLGTATTAPYTVNWTGATAGSYSIVAKATNTLGVSTVSSAASIVVAQLSQTITFAPLPNQTLGAAPFTLSATASSGLAVSFSSTTPTICSVSGTTVTLLLAGNCIIDATQFGNSTYSAAPYVQHNFTISGGSTPQTITFPSIPNKTLSSSAFTLNATASSGLTVSYTSTTFTVCSLSSNTVSIVGAGTCGIIAHQAGNGTYAAATPVLQSFSVGASTLTSQTINFPAIPSKPLAIGSFTLSATASSGLTVSFTATPAVVCSVSGSTVTLVGAGTCNITASQVGNATYAAATPVPQSFSVTASALTSQTLNFPVIPSKPLAIGSFTLSATASSGLMVSFSATPAAVCTVSGNTVTLVSAGTCNITASQAGNATYAAATPVTQPFTVTAALPTVSLTSPTNGTSIHAGSTVTLHATASETGGTIAQVQYYANGALLGNATVSPYSVNWVNIPAGTYAVTAQAIDAAGISVNSAVATVTVTAATAPVVTLTAPANGASVTGPASLTLSATASETGGTISQVSFYSDGAFVGTITTAPYTITLPHIALGTYSITAQATDSLGVVSTSAASEVTVTANPAFHASLTANVAASVAPTSIALTASVTDSGSTVTQVQFFNGATLLGTVTNSPYTYNWAGVPAGEYALTVVVTNSAAATVTTAPVTVVVGDVPDVGSWKTYYVQTDQLNTPRVISNQAGTTVWQWLQTEPFGDTPPNQDPNNSGTQFIFNLRFAGQYADVETGLFYNYFRDYDPLTGRYVESDPIGLAGGSFSTFAYVKGNSLGFIDPLGLAGSNYKVEAAPTTPAMVPADNLLQALADTAAANVDATCGIRCLLPWIRGTLIHSEFKRLVDSQCPASKYRTEVSYKNGAVVPYGTPGSSRADVVFGPILAPIAVYDLKTGWAYMSVGQAEAYGANLPALTPFGIIRPAGR